MLHRQNRRRALVLAGVLAVAVGAVQAAPRAQPAPPPFTHFTNQTLRQIVRAGVGGSRVRVMLSNAFGTAPFTISAAHIALRDTEDTIQASYGRALTFSGRVSVTIPVMGIVYSDPVTLAVPSLADLAIDIYLPGTTDVASPLTMHTSSFQTTYISETGNHAGAPKFPTVATVRSWFFLSRVEVDAADTSGIIVASTREA